MEKLTIRARAVAGDRDAGASEVVRELLPVLADALALGEEAVRNVVRVVCATQPSMAPVWNACAAAVADLTTPGRFARFQQELTHQRRSVIRVAAAAIADLLQDSADPTIVTWSYSGTVAAVIAQLATTRRVTVICAEGRPRFEGRRLAATLASTGARVVLTTDAGATSMLERVSAVVVGADAILAERWINKVGTRALAVAASQIGRPVVVVATRDKALAPILEEKLELPAGDVAEVWSDRPEGVEISSPVFEPIPAELATWFATDVGLLTPSDLPAFVRRYEAEARLLIPML
jgi:translation initiation factor 2B subunit (eIF-2B alpha/beta/delta family)